MNSRRAAEAGFSLIELMVAMVVTLIITGAMFGLMVQGQSAFRRDPERSERQQAIRVAMDLIQRDIATAGMMMGSFATAFEPGLDGAGTQPSTINPGENADALLIYGNDGTCPSVPGVKNGVNVEALMEYPSCYQNNEFVVVLRQGAEPLWGLGFNLHAANGKMNFPQGQNMKIPTKVMGPGDLTGVTGLVKLHFIRYEIAPDIDGLASLWRSATGGFDRDSGDWVAPGPGTPYWQLVARGVEDIQVWYTALMEPPAGPPLGPVSMDPKAGWSSDPGVVVNLDYSSIVTQVRVALSSRSTATNVQGVTTPGAGIEAAIRGQLVSSTTPRAALFAFQKQEAGAGVILDEGEWQ